MTAVRTLDRLCRLHGVPLTTGRRLLPLVERAEAAPPVLRRLLLRVVEATLERDAEELSLQRGADERCLAAVAAALHGWRSDAAD